jgi:subtilisin family serine protease
MAAKIVILALSLFIGTANFIGAENHVLKLPTAWPSAVRPSFLETTVTFRTLLTSPQSLPTDGNLILEVFKGDGNQIRSFALNDEGRDGDKLKGDGFYTGETVISIQDETFIFYRLRLGNEVGPNVLFPITRLPLKPRDIAPGRLVPYQETSSLFFADELLLQSSPGIPPEAIIRLVRRFREENIIPSAEIVQFIPLVNVYVIQFDGGNTAEGVYRAMEIFANTQEVNRVSPNFQVNNEASHQIAVGGIQYPWHFSSINALPALERDAKGDGIKVAVIDDGIYPHTDLTDQFDVIANPAGMCGDVTIRSSHGTWVAGVIAAKENSNNVTGIAPLSKVVDCGKSTTQSRLDLAITAIAEVIAISEVRILNLSWTTGPDSLLDEAVCTAICADRLVVAAAGSLPDDDCNPKDLFNRDSYPARYNASKPRIMCPCAAEGAIPIDHGLLAVGALDNNGIAAWDMDTGSHLSCSSNSRSALKILYDLCRRVSPRAI